VILVEIMSSEDKEKKKKRDESEDVEKKKKKEKFDHNDGEEKKEKSDDNGNEKKKHKSDDNEKEKKKEKSDDNKKEKKKERSEDNEGEKSKDESRGVKRSSDSLTVPEVHSVNDWEHVDMGGDESRKNKFLRLMGANKKEHRGLFVIGDKKPSSQGRQTVDTEKVAEDLEDQYRQSVDLRLSGAARRHKGLGFQQDDLAAQSNEVGFERMGSSHEGDTEGASVPPIEPEPQRNDEKNRTVAAKPKGMYGFVKSAETI